MKLLAVNGSPRKDWNTAMLLNSALEGAASKGASTELIHLYDLDYKGCMSCFACKRLGSKSYGKCAVTDDLAPVLKKIEEADALVIGSPIYFGDVTGQLRAFLERLMFQYLLYDEGYSSLFKKKIQTAFIYTMNVNQDRLEKSGYEQKFQSTAMAMEKIFGSVESLFVTDTYQFDDYSKYITTAFDAEAKAKRRREEFPKDCEKAFDMGVRFASSGIKK